MRKSFLLVPFLFLLVQYSSFTVDINLEKFFYQPGESVNFDVTIENETSLKECLQSLTVTVEDSTKTFYSVVNNYPPDTECIESGDRKTYSFLCAIPLNVSEGTGRVGVEVETWSGIDESREEFFTIGVNYPPVITIHSYPSVVNPSQEYSLTFSVSDNFGAEDIASCEVALYHELVSSERECSIFTWEKPALLTAWKSDSPVRVEASLQPGEIVWTIDFSLSEIAFPGEWILEIKVYDMLHQYSYVSEGFTVTKYLSFHLDSSRSSAARINFGKGSPGEELAKVSLYMVVTSNTSVDISVQADNLYSPDGGVLPVYIFYVDTPQGAIQLDGSRQILYPAFAGKNGYSKETQVRLVFWGKLPEAVKAGTYSGVWYIIVEPV